jgi:steroid delta-isomerase-like uncharacterized protein
LIAGTAVAVCLLAAALYCASHRAPAKEGSIMRRRCALLLVALVGLLVSGRLPGVTAAEDATPRAAPDASLVALPPLVQQWIAAFDAGDGHALAALYTPDGVYEDVTQPTLYGRPAIAAFIDHLALQQTAISVQQRAIHRTNDGAVLEYVWRSTIVATGQPIALRGAIVFVFADDHIERSADYYDLEGIRLPAALAGTPAATPAA